MNPTLETILAKFEQIELPPMDTPTGIQLAIHVFNLYTQGTSTKYYKIEPLSNHYSLLHRNSGRDYIGLVSNKDVITLAQTLVKKCKEV